MKVALDARFLSNRGTGIASYIWGLIEGIQKSTRIPKDAFEFLVSKGFDCDDLSIRRRACDIPVVSLKQHILMPSYLLGVKANVYHYPHFDLPLSFGKKSVITIYDLKYIKMSHLFHKRSRNKAFMMKRMMVNSCKRADAIITISKSSKRDMTELLGVSPEKISVVYCATDSFYHEVKDVDKTLLGKLGIDRPFILYVGELRPHKNIIRLIEALKRSYNKDYMLVVVGKSYKDFNDPFAAAHRLHLEHRIKFLMYIEKKELLHLYNAAKIFVLPSLYEGFGLPVLEAMACGTPVITSNVSSMPEVGGDAALLVDPYNTDQIANAIDSLLLNENARREMREKGFEQNKKFSWITAANETFAVYQNVLI